MTDNLPNPPAPQSETGGSNLAVNPPVGSSPTLDKKKPSPLLLLGLLILLVILLLGAFYFKNNQKAPKKDTTPTTKITPTVDQGPTFSVTGDVGKIEVKSPTESVASLTTDNGRGYEVTLTNKVKLNKYQAPTLKTNIKLITDKGDYKQIKTGDRLYVLGNVDLSKTSQVTPELIIQVEWYAKAESP